MKQSEIKEREKPILFKEEMIRQILNNSKTQTRRLVKPQPIVNVNGLLNWFCENPGKKHVWFGMTEGLFKQNILSKCPYGKVGTILWVRETWGRFIPEHVIDKKFFYQADVTTAEGEEYRLDYVKLGYPYQYKPSIHMPKEACRIRLRITDIRVERLQDITEEDSEAEGVEAYDTHSYIPGEAVMQIEQSFSAKQVYQKLWSKINGPESWASNPWVWVIKFERI